MSTLVEVSRGGMDEPMLPKQPPNVAPATSTAKRKGAEEEDVLSKAAKRLKVNPSAKSTATTSRKKGEEQIGGLVIVRGPPPRPSSAQDNHRPVSSSQSSFPPRPASTKTNRTLTAGPSKPNGQTLPEKPSKPPSTSNPRANIKGKQREVPLAAAGEQEVEEDVRQMNTEAEDLRDRSRSQAANMTPGARKIDFAFPSSSGPAVKSRVRQLQEQAGSVGSRGALGTPPGKGTVKDSMHPIPEQETPQIAKNKLMRGDHPSMKPAASASGVGIGRRHGSTTPGTELGGHHRRRSSLSMRGKRVSASFDATGLISQPHTSVLDSALYKHIDPDLPESHRARQLLIWASSRSMHDPSNSSTSQRRRSSSKIPAQNAPLSPLPAGGSKLLKEVEEDVIRQLAEKLIDTSVHSPPDEGAGAGKTKDQENEQNVKNRAREKLFMAQIEERKAEDVAWGEVSQFYNAHQANVLASLDKRHRAQTPTSAKARGKQRATSQEPVDFEPREQELPDCFRGANGFEVAKRLVEQGVDAVGKGDRRLQELRYKEDCIHAAVSTAHQLARIAASDLDHRFSLLSLSLSQRTQPASHTFSSSSNPSSLSNYLPISSLPHLQQPTTDPQDLLRALSRTDAERPPSQVGDAVRKAAKDVRRVHDGVDGGLRERKLTDVPPSTPRKPPGTPRRVNTPDPGRKG